ncbi:MAG TPA: hypothetical protein VKS21_01480 [Spirochaetota bacterium]|nr:hypothetical protein [Spirochaetota bacterium]
MGSRKNSENSSKKVFAAQKSRQRLINCIKNGIAEHNQTDNSNHGADKEGTRAGAAGEQARNNDNSLFKQDNSESNLSDPLTRLRQKWRVSRHFVKGEDFISLFARKKFSDFSFTCRENVAIYKFAQHSCIKKQKISGLINSSSEAQAYFYVQKKIYTWESVSAEELALTLAGGYIYQRLGRDCPVFRDLADASKPVVIRYYFHDTQLILEDAGGSDYKELQAG